MMKNTLLILLFLCFKTFGQAPGSVDTSFGTNGIAMTSIAYYSPPTCLAIQADGKIVVGGYASTGSFFCIRYNTDGSLDMSFGTGGMVSTVATNFYTSSSSIGIQADQKIILGSGKVLVRYNTDGSLDTSFGAGGTVVVPSREIWALKIEVSTGKIVLAANTYNGNNNLIVVRFNPSGDLDLSFNTTGTKILKTTSPSTFTGVLGLTDLAIDDSSGKISIVGYANVLAGISFFSYGLAYRLNANGSWDSSFSGDGIGGYVASTYTMLLKPDNSIIGAGAQDSNIFMYMINPNGTNSPTNVFSSIPDLTAKYLKQDSNTKYVLAASGTSPTNPFKILVVNPDFTLDTSFGTDGFVTPAFMYGLHGLCIQSDGKIIVLGTLETTVKLARFNGSAPLLKNDTYSKLPFSLYPNPAENEISLDITNEKLLNEKFQICDINGRTVYSGIISALTTKIDIGMLNHGMYFLSIENSSTTLKIIKT